MLQRFVGGGDLGGCMKNKVYALVFSLLCVCIAFGATS
jgi:hypothetical protein